MRLSTMIKVTFAVAAGLSLAGAVAWAQNLRVMGTTTGEGGAHFNRSLSVSGPITMTSPDTSIYSISLSRTNELGRWHQWSWWHMNTGYGQDSLQLYEYQSDSAGLSCTGNAADGAICAPRLTVAKGGNVGIGFAQAAHKLDVNGDIRANGWLRTEGQAGWYSQTYGGGWYMSDPWWVRTYDGKNVWTGNGVLGSDGGLTVGYGGTTPPSNGAIINGTVGVGTLAPDARFKLDVRGAIAAGTSEIYFTDTAHQHSGIGNHAGFAAIENSANYGALMILGRTLKNGERSVHVYDHLYVNGKLRSATGRVVYTAAAGCTRPPGGTLTVNNTCEVCVPDYSEGGGVICSLGTNSIAGRLVDY